MSEDMRKVIDDIKLGNYQSEPVNTNFDYEIKEKPGMFDEVMEKASKTNAYKKYFSTQADVLEEAKTINKETGIPFNAIIAGNVEKAREIYDYKKKQMDPDAVYEAYPGLSKLAQMNENDAAIALHDMENVKMVHGFFEAAKVGFDSDSLTAERNNLGLDKFMGKAVDEDRLKDIDKELEGLKEIPSLLEAPVESIVGGFAQQAPMMARNLLKGQAYGAAGAVTGFMLGAIGGGVLTGGSASPAFGLQGARIGYSVGSRVGFATEMFKESVGGYYLDYIGYKDKNGNQLLSDDEARNYAAVTALAETGIEMANFDKVLDILKGSKSTLPAAKIVENIVKNAKDNASVQAQLKTWLNSNLKNFGTVALTESAEEGVQRMSEMTITKVAQTLNPDGDIPDYSAEDILKGGVEAAYTALPASIGFGGSAVAASGMRFTRQAAQLMTIGKERADEALRTNTGIELVNKLMEAARTTKMGKDHKETFNNLMKANLKGTAHEKAYVDTELLMEQEGGEVVLNQLAAVAGLTEEQLKTFKETGTPIEVNTADYVSTMAGDNQINLSDYISFDAADRCLARNQRVAEEWKKLQNQVNTREVERLIENINTLTTEMFGGTEERDYANRIISEYENPSAGIAERRRQIDLEIDEMIVPVIEQMRKGMRQGVGFYETDDYGNTLAPEEHDVHVGGAKFLTNNDMWYSKYYAKNRKVPTEQELRELAEEAITGSNPYGIGDFDYSDPDMVAYAEETKAQIDKLRHELELLDSIEGKLKNVDRGEFAALDALTQEGVKVYKEVADKLRAMPNKAIGRQATMGALIYAHLADRFAAAKRATGDKKYTALDFLKANPIEFGGEAEQGALGQSAAMKREYYPDMRSFINALQKNNDRIAKIGNWVKTSKGGEIIISGSAYKHVQDGNHPLTAEQWQVMIDELENIEYAARDFAKGRNNGIPVGIKINTTLGKAGVMFEFLPNGKVLFVTAVFNNDNAIDNWIKNKKSFQTLGIEDKEPQNRLLDNSFITIIQEKLGIVKGGVLNQSAWHGTGAVFEKFDLGAIGTGEGNQVHGWGLYFAKDKNVARGYQEMLSDVLPEPEYVKVGNTTLQKIYDRLEVDLFDGEGDFAQYALVEYYMTNRYDFENTLKYGNEMGYSEEAISWFKEKFKDVKFNTGKLFEVDVPEDDVLLDEQKTFAEQPVKVRKAITKLVKNLTEDQMANFDDVYSLGKAKVAQKILKSFEDIDGGTIYGTIYDLIEDEGTGKNTSELLNKYGVKGIGYNSGSDGRCFVVFDDKAISVINRFNQAAGQKAKTANLAALQEAMAMYDNYEDDKAIYKKTGWYRGADGKWRFDIPDNFDKIDLSELPDAGYSVQLKDLYDNPALYKAYPWLGEALVTVGELTKGYRGTADSANNVIELSSELVKKGDREIIGIGKARFIRTKTNEETEQWQPLSGEVLSDVERMAIGMITANGNDVDKAIGEAQSEIDKSIESIKFNEANRPNSQMLQIAKQNLATNKSILETLQGIKQKGFAYTSFPFTDEEKTREEIGKTLMHEIQHLIQDNEGFARGGNPIHVHAQMRRQIDNYRRRALAIDQNAQPYYNRKRDWEAAIIEGASPEKIQALKKELSFLEELVPEEKRQPIIDLLGEADRLERQLKESINPFYDYQNLHGEQEARAASRKAEINTKIKQLETIEVKTLDEILANNIEKVAPENQAAIREWVELNKKFDEATIEEVKKLNERQSEIEAQVKDDAGAQAFFGEYDENFEAEWNKNDIGNLERDYTEEVLEGVSPYNAIVVFGGDVVSGYAVGPKGQTKIKSNGQKVIRLFETADESTFIHEMGHVAYENLRELASQENSPAQFKRDIKILDNWANWKEGQIDEYVGTATYKEFAARDNAIKEAMASGDEALVEQLKYEWRQERFARGWEEYLKKGKAPTEGLRKVFYQFKKWLTSIYKAYRAIGGAPTKEVEDVMKRMLLTDEAIELAEKKAEIEAFEKSGVFDYLGNDNSKSMWQKIMEEIRAEASAKVMKIAMKDMSETAKLEREEKINAEREATRQRMAKEPVWAIYSTLKYNPKASVSAVCKAFNMTVEEYANALKANGGTFERAVDNYMQIYTAELKAPNKQEIEARAEEAVTTSYYKQLLDAFELELLQRKVRQEVRLSKKIAGIVAETEEERAAQEKALRELDKKAEEARSQKALRDVAVGNVETIKNYARQKMAVMPIEYSANPTVWKNASRQKAAEMTAALAKKDYGKAVQAAKMRLTYDAMTDIATENKLFVDRKSKKMRDRAKTVRREKNMAADERYVYFHLLYAFGLAERDVPIPPSYKGFVDTVIAHKEAHDYGLENMSVSFVNNEGQLMMSDFIINAGTGEAVYRKGISELTVSEFKELNDVMDNLYTVAVEANKIKTVTGEDGKTVTIEDAIKEMAEDIAKRRKEPEIKDPTNAGNIHTWDSILDIGNKFHLSLIKAETLLEEMGAAFTKYLYDPIKHAAEKELEMTVEYAKKIEEIKQAWYNDKVVKYMNQGMTEDEARKAADKEFKEMYTAEKYKLGTSTLTKENIIAFALNWGTKANRDRALNYGGTTKAAFERIFAELDGADWQFVANVWDLFDETWPQVKEVGARVSGVTLEKQEGIAFTITGKDGATYAIQGKYYPIKYDPKKTAKAETYQKEEGLRSKLPSMARMGVGVGMTKERAVKTNYLIRNDLGVFGEAINENIHLITMREAVRDVSRIINDAQFVALMERYMGKNVVPMLQEWALDCWQVEPKVKGELEEAMAYARKKQTMAVLGFRASTAFMNVANLAPVTNYLGAARTLDALTSFYAHPQDQYDFVMERSPFMNNRAQTMDRDMRDVIKNKGIMGKKLDWIEQKAFVMLTQSDLMLANPLWLSEYQRVYRENVDKGLAPSVIERMAVDAGDKAVRTVFGSGMVQDLAAVQKGGEVTKMLTMFYSYFSVVYQAISRAYYERRRRTINKEDWLKRNAPVLDLILYWFILPSAMIVATKMGMAWATGDDDEEFTVQNFLIKTGAESLNTAAGTIPILRDVSSMALTYLTEGRYYGARSTPIGELEENVMDVIRSIKGYAEDKKDVDDVVRAVLRGTAYATGLPVVGADGIATIMQWFEYGDATPEEIWQYLAAIMAGKRVEK